MKLDARPVTRHPATSHVVALFYPLRNHTCPPPSTTIGGCIVARMLSGKEVSVHCESSYGGKRTKVCLCRECRLGAVTQPGVSIHCIHGPWGLVHATTIAAQRLGAKVESCGFCGKTYSPRVEWTTAPEPVERLFCGKRCRERFRVLSDP